MGRACVLFSSLAAKYATKRMSCKIIIAADTEKHGRNLLEKAKKMKLVAEKTNENLSVKSEGTESYLGYESIEDVVFDSESQSFLRKTTTSIVKSYECTEFMDLFDMTFQNVIVISFYGCYGNDMDFVPSKKNLENALLEMGMTYDDDQLDSKESRRILYNMVLIRIKGPKLQEVLPMLLTVKITKAT